MNLLSCCHFTVNTIRFKNDTKTGITEEFRWHLDQQLHIIEISHYKYRFNSITLPLLVFLISEGASWCVLYSIVKTHRLLVGFLIPQAPVRHLPGNQTIPLITTKTRWTLFFKWRTLLNWRPSTSEVSFWIKFLLTYTLCLCERWWSSPW